MAKIGLPKGSGKRLKVSEKSGNFEMYIEWQPCENHCPFIGPRSAVGNVSGYRCVSDCRSRGREFDPGLV